MWVSLAFSSVTPRWDMCLDSPVSSWAWRPLTSVGAQLPRQAWSHLLSDILPGDSPKTPRQVSSCIAGRHYQLWHQRSTRPPTSPEKRREGTARPTAASRNPHWASLVSPMANGDMVSGVEPWTQSEAEKMLRNEGTDE